MIKVSSTEFQNRFGQYKKEVRNSPIVITNHGRDDLVLLSINEFTRLKALNRRSFYAHELPKGVIDRFLTVPIPEEAFKYNDEFEQ
jgi:prevent-host-death family protein